MLFRYITKAHMFKLRWTLPIYLSIKAGPHYSHVVVPWKRVYHLSIRSTGRHLRLLNNLNNKGQDQRFPKYFLRHSCHAAVLCRYETNCLGTLWCHHHNSLSICLWCMPIVSYIRKYNVATGRMQCNAPSYSTSGSTNDDNFFCLSVVIFIHMLSKYCSGFVVDLYLCVSAKTGAYIRYLFFLAQSQHRLTERHGCCRQ